ncbi:NUDIX domain-containing protein [Streptomyces sp. NPDC059118]|uniref:NUDIX domain-containing protein n=1 Tax=unclassified Streptomyces TaxID=2593676 RepID=UPI0036CDED3A
MEERPEDGVCREVLEETGIKVRVEHLIGVHKNTTRGIIALVFLFRPVGARKQVPQRTRPHGRARTRAAVPVRAHDRHQLL